MPNYYPNPKEVAARYRVEKNDGDTFKLCSENGSSVNLNHLGAFLYVQTTLNAIKWHVSKEEEAFYAIYLLVSELNIGFPGDEGWSSHLVDNCFFAIDGEALMYLPLTKIRVVSEDQYQIEETRIALNKGEKLATKTTVNNTLAPYLARAKIVHCPSEDEYDPDEVDSCGFIDCTIGLKQALFQRLLDGCLSARVSGVYFRGFGGALSSSFQHGATRDLILLAGGEFDFDIDSLTIDYLTEKP